MKRWAWFGLLLLFLAGCGRGPQDLPDVTVQVGIEPDPPRLGLTTVTISLYNAKQEPISGAAVEIEGNMSHAGMVPVFATASEVAPGRYQAELDFTMGGDWFLLVRTDLPDGRSLERKIDVPGVDAVCGDTPTP
jgi:hypothetical protein